MKLKRILTTVSMITVMMAGSAVMASAADADAAATTSAINIVPTMNFTGTPIKLSLEDAIKIMQTSGSGAQAAELNQKKDNAIALGYTEGYQSAASGLKNASLDPTGMTDTGNISTNKKQAALSRDYAKAQTPNNYQASMNSLESQTISTYYGVLQALDNMNVARDNLKVQEDLLNITNKKLSLGLVAKKDLLSAQNAVATAKSELQAATTAAKQAKMGFNMLLGNELMQEFTLTDSLIEVTPDAITLEDAIKGALANRNEIKQVAYGVEMQKIILDGLKYRYPSYSATYLQAQIGVLEAEKGYADILKKIEMDVRASYMALTDKKMALDAAKVTSNYANEGYRLANLSYQSGMATLNDVQQAQISAFRAGQGLSKAITEYDLAVYSFRYEIGVGTTRVEL